MFNLNILLSVLVFLAIFSVLILVHECGHFFVARKCKVKVEEFGLGIPPRAKKLGKIGDTLFSLNWIPFGGFVKMYGEDSEEKLKSPHAFSNRPVLQRMAIVLAGVVMNFLLAIVLLSVGYTIGMTPIILPTELNEAITNGKAVSTISVKEAIADSPAATAGLRTGDVIEKIGEAKVATTDDVMAASQDHAGETISYTVLRGIEEMTIPVTLDEKSQAGIWLQQDVVLKSVQYPFYQAPLVAAQDTLHLSVETVRFAGLFFWKIVTQGQVEEGVGGPVMIASITYELVAIGAFMDLLKFTALISISLGVINVFPIPALDGGRFVFLAIEGLTGKKLKQVVEIWVNQIGFVLLILLIFFITYRDILSLFVK